MYLSFAGQNTVHPRVHVQLFVGSCKVESCANSSFYLRFIALWVCFCKRNQIMWVKRVGHNMQSRFALKSYPSYFSSNG